MAKCIAKQSGDTLNMVEGLYLAKSAIYGGKAAKGLKPLSPRPSALNATGPVAMPLGPIRRNTTSFCTFSPHQRLSFLHWAAFNLSCQIQIGTIPNQRPRSFRWPTSAGNNNCLVVKISHRDYMRDMCHPHISSHREAQSGPTVCWRPKR